MWCEWGSRTITSLLFTCGEGAWMLQTFYITGATDWRGRGLLYFTMHVFLHKPQKHHCSIVYMCVHTSSPTHSPAWPAPGSRCMDVQKQWRVRTPNKVTSIALDRCGHIIYVIITVRSLMVYIIIICFIIIVYTCRYAWQLLLAFNGFIHTQDMYTMCMCTQTRAHMIVYNYNYTVGSLVR